MTPPESLDIAEQKRRFHWQCRRGASEVEVVLNAYLERFFEVDDVGFTHHKYFKSEIVEFIVCAHKAA